MPAAPLASTLLRFRLKATARRLSHHRFLALTVTLGLIAALLALFQGARSLAAADVTELALRDRLFWLGTLTALVYSYTTFEVFFRAPDAAFMTTLPIRNETRFDDLFSRALALHLPLLLPALIYTAALALDRPTPAPALYALALSLSQFAIGLPLSIALHLWAGRSLLARSSDLKRLFAGATVSDDAALLVYAPALGLLGTLVLGIFLDLSLRDAILRDRPGLLAPALLGAAVASALAFRQARRLASEALHRILPRFSEVDVPPPYREDGLRRVVPGEWLAPHLGPARPHFLRDLRQLRRRYRLDGILRWVFLAIALERAHDTANLTVTMLEALALMNGVFIVSAFRLRGELASPSLDRTLPASYRNATLGRLAASAFEPAIALVSATCAALTTGNVPAAALTLGLGLLLTAALVGLSHLIATLGATRPALTATLWRVAVVALATTLGGP